MFEAKSQRNGVTVHWARDGHEHNHLFKEDAIALEALSETTNGDADSVVMNPPASCPSSLRLSLPLQNNGDSMRKLKIIEHISLSSTVARSAIPVAIPVARAVRCFSSIEKAKCAEVAKAS
jgi:hypothetical protein